MITKIKLTDNLPSIIDAGLSGSLKVLTEEDWKILELLIDNNGSVQYYLGYNKGVREGYRMKNDNSEGEE